MADNYALSSPFYSRFTIHTISFGDYADDDLLRVLANENHGTWTKILSDLDSALQVSRLRFLSYFLEIYVASHCNILLMLPFSHSHIFQPQKDGIFLL